MLRHGQKARDMPAHVYYNRSHSVKSPSLQLANWLVNEGFQVVFMPC